MGEVGRDGVVALARGQAGMIAEAASLAPYKGRLSEKVARALVAAGIDAPERLLFISEADIAKVPGIGAVARREIGAYRARFLPPD